MDILEKLANLARDRSVEKLKEISLEELKERALKLPTKDFEFEKALKKSEIAFICECKKASPSKGIIAEDFDYIKIAREYEEAGADCISVLTEPEYFLGSDLYLKEIAGEVKIPCIRKDFIVNEYMIYEARVLGASAVLLICAILTEGELIRYIEICDELGMSALVEAHDQREIEMALRVGARLIGVNNRNLKDFSVDTGNAKRLKELVSDEVIFVSESGISTREDIIELEAMGVNAVLVGESLMRAKDKRKKLDYFRGYD